MTGRRLGITDLRKLIGLHVSVTVTTPNGDERQAAGVIAMADYGAFGGLFVEFDDGDSSIGWNSEDAVMVTITAKPSR